MYLKVSNLTKIYGDKKVVNNVSFTAEKGSMTCVLGPSGSGKTTILRTLGGFQKPESGTIILDNKDISNLEPEERPISTVFQSYGLFPHKNVMENIIYGLKFKNVSKKNAMKEGRKILEMIGLKEYGSRRIDQLSGGEQQRVALGRSLIVKPDLLLLDEPLSNLDAKLKLIMREEIQKIQRIFNITTIFVTHDQEDAFSVGDQIILMDEGKIEQISSPMDVYNNPAGKFPLEFIGRSNIRKSGKKLEYLRPERVKIHKQALKNTVQGKINKRIFKGHIVEYHISTREDDLIAIELSGDQLYNENEIINLEIPYKIIGEN